MINEKNFSLTIMLSLIMHILLFMIFPYITPPPAKVYSYSEVDLSKVSFDDIKEKIEDEVKIVDKKSPVDINEKDKIIPQESEDINKLMIPENKGYQLVSPKYGVNLPSRAQQEAGDKFQVSIKNDKGAPTDVPFGEPDIKEHNLAPDTNIFNNREGIYRPGMEDGKETPTQESVKGHYSKFKEKYVPPAAQKPKEE
ncbi:MAG: hypothetical protein HY934_08085, partial [Candidatus Firestonebacteria bacterium]|nr:hypothetical protein [Candidatus Firestonebacteria bacterium]